MKWPGHLARGLLKKDGGTCAHNSRGRLFHNSHTPPGRIQRGRPVDRPLFLSIILPAIALPPTIAPRIGPGGNSASDLAGAVSSAKRVRAKSLPFPQVSEKIREKGRAGLDLPCPLSARRPKPRRAQRAGGILRWSQILWHPRGRAIADRPRPFTAHCDRPVRATTRDSWRGSRCAAWTLTARPTRRRRSASWRVGRGWTRATGRWPMI